MSPSYSLEQFLDIVTQYNHAISPMQTIAYIVGLAALLFARIKTNYSNKIVSAILALQEGSSLFTVKILIEVKEI